MAHITEMRKTIWKIALKICLDEFRKILSWKSFCCEIRYNFEPEKFSIMSNYHFQFIFQSQIFLTHVRKKKIRKNSKYIKTFKSLMKKKILKNYIKPQWIYLIWSSIDIQYNVQQNYHKFYDTNFFMMLGNVHNIR